MSEKSKGDTSRIVKNPLLSASVTGLTFDDFTHNALLLPAAPPIEKTIPEDVNYTKEPQPTVTVGKKIDIDTTTFSEISLNPSVDEDLPLPQATNLDSQLEGPPDESLLYQAASSFVQLPSVASTVFSTFSKVLKDYTPTAGQSREVSEDKDVSEPDAYSAPQVPDPYPIAPPQPQESATFAPPPTFYSPTDVSKLSAGPPPAAASQNTYRLSSKKKAYAQVPGLSSHAASINHPQTSSVPPSSGYSQGSVHNLQSDFSKQLNLNDIPSSIESDGEGRQEERSGGLFSLSSFVPPVLQNLTGFGKSSPSEITTPLQSQADNYNSGRSVVPGQVSGSHGITLGQPQQELQQPFLFNPSSYSTLVSQTQEKHHQNLHQTHTVESQQRQDHTPAIIPTNTEQQRKLSRESHNSGQDSQDQLNQPQLYNPATLPPTTPPQLPQLEPQKVPSFFTPTSQSNEKFGFQEPREKSIQSLFDTKLFQQQHSWNPLALGSNAAPPKPQEKQSEPVPVSLFNPVAPQIEAQKPSEPSQPSDPPKEGFIRGPTSQQPLLSPQQAVGSSFVPTFFDPSKSTVSTNQDINQAQQPPPIFFNPLQSGAGPVQQPFLNPVVPLPVAQPPAVVQPSAFPQPARPPSIGNLPENQEQRRLSTDSQGSVQPPPKLGPPGQGSVSNFRLQKGTRHYKSALTSSNVPPLNLPPSFPQIPSSFQAPSQNFSPPPPPLNTPIAPLPQIYFPPNVNANKPQPQGENLVQEINAKFEPTAPPLSDFSRPGSVDVVKPAIPVTTLGQPAYQEQQQHIEQQYRYFQQQQKLQQEQQPLQQTYSQVQPLQQQAFYVGQAPQQEPLQQQLQQQPGVPSILFNTVEHNKEANLPPPPTVGSIQPPPLSGFFRATTETTDSANLLAPAVVPVRKDSEIVDREVQQLTAVSESFSSEGFKPFVAQEEKLTDEPASTYENIVIHHDQVKASEQIVEHLEAVPLQEPESKAAPYQLLRPDEHHLVRDTPSELSDSQETSKFYLFKPIEKPEESIQAAETVFPQDSDVTKDIEHIPTLKYVPSEPKLKSIGSDLEYINQKENEVIENIVQEPEQEANRPVISIANYFSNQPGNTFEHSNLFSQSTDKPQVPLNNYNSDQTNNNQTDSVATEHVEHKNPNLDSLNNNQNLQHQSALSSFFSSPQVSQCTVIENNINDAINENLPILEKSTQDPLEFFNTFQQGVQSENNTVLSEDINSQSIQNFFNNPPQNLSNLTSDLNYNLVSGGIVSANLQNLRVTQTRGGLRTSSPLSTLVEPPSSACSELSSEVSSQFGANSFYKPNDTNDNSEIFDPAILELFDMSTIKESNMNANTNVAYRPVTRHWFYKKPVDSKHIWTPFSHLDSNLIEENFNEEALFFDQTIGGKNIIPVEGGRYDVKISERTRIPIYWAGEATEVRRCSWFYKAVDSRYCPYEEAIADILEEEYKNASVTGEWRRKIPLPTGETVVFHGPTVMVHYLPSQSADSWSSTSVNAQTPSRPRVVKRDIEEFSIEEGECKKVDHILFMVHGIGSVCDLKFRKVEEVVDEFRSIATQLVQAHYKNSRESGDIGRVEVLPVSWHSELHSEESGIDKRLRAITLESIPKLRNFANDTLLDVLFYTSPVFCQSIMNTVAGTMNKVYLKYCQRNPEFKGGVSLAGHSLGSLILFDLLCHQQRVEEIDLQNSENPDETIEPMEFVTAPVADPNTTTAKQISYTVGSAGTGQPFINYPHLLFAPEKFFALGSPIGMFVTIRGIDALGLEFKLPTCPRFYNIFHPYDPVAYRIEALVNPDLSSLRPVLIPHHKGRKRMHLELKETMTRVGADIKQKIFDTFRSTVDRLTIKHKTDPKEIEKEVDKVLDIQLKLETEPQTSERTRNNSVSVHSDVDSGETDLPLGDLNCSNRIDYVLQEAPLEFFNEYLFALKSHVCYWDSEDTILFIMKEIYSALGFRPDSQVPQQNMTIERPSSRCSSTQVSPTKSTGSS